MSTVTENAEQQAAQPSRQDFAAELRQNTTGIKFQVTRLGTRGKLSQAQIERAAQLFHTDPKYLSGSKRLLNIQNEHWKRVSSIISQATSLWKSYTYPYPETIGDQLTTKGTRLIALDKVEELEGLLAQKKEELAAAVAELQQAWPQIRDESRALLAALHAEADYPDTVIGLFDIEWSFVSVEPPTVFFQMHPEIYERETQRLQRRMEEAIYLHEQHLAIELQKLVNNMLEKMQPGEDGKKKSFSKTNFESFQKFFDGFRQMNIGSNAELDRAVEDAQRALEGVTSSQLNKDQSARDAIGEGMNALAERLSTMIIVKPTRRIRLRKEEEQLSLLDGEVGDETEESAAEVTPEAVDAEDEAADQQEADAIETDELDMSNEDVVSDRMVI